MIKRKSKIFLAALLPCLCVSTFNFSFAQYFSDNPDTSASSFRRSSSWSVKTNNQAKTQSSSNSGTSQPNSSAKQNPNLRRNYLSDKKEFIGTVPTQYKSQTQQLLSPTVDGSQRGAVAMGQIVRKNNGRLTAAATSSIFLYYDNFSIRRGLMGDVSCDVRFYVMTTLDRKLSTLSVKLKWPKMETALNFMDVPPNVETYFDYTLVGDGCYSMDKTPNVIVNRCRVTKMSQEECAAKIKWLKKGY